MQDDAVGALRLDLRQAAQQVPGRSLPVLVAIPFKFMGKPYYHARRAELEEQLTAAQLGRITFVKADLAREIIEKYHFGDRWPSSGVITIWHILRAQPRVHLHGFDFFKQIVRRARAILSTFARNTFPSPRNSLTVRPASLAQDGKIHYMEDTHQANHNGKEEERICMDFVAQGRVSFVG